MNKIISLLVLLYSVILAHHGTSPDWSNPVPIPKVNTISKQRGTLYNNSDVETLKQGLKLQARACE